MHVGTPIHIAILGTRGIPARYGGFETFAEELSVRLLEHGLRVTVYCRRSIGAHDRTQPLEHRGVKLVYTPTIFHKYLETPLHALTSFVCVLRDRPDAILLCNAANSPFAWIARLAGIPVVINVDGIERMRSKWNMFGKWWYRLGEVCSVLFASVLVADAEVIAAYYRKRFGVRAKVISYGATFRDLPVGKTLEQFNLKPDHYILYVSRLEPENNALGVIRAYNLVHHEIKIPLVIVGDAPYASEYKDQLRAEAGPGIIFTGFQFGDAYHELRNHCRLYIQATEVGGTHPALIEAMAAGNCIIANGTPENLEVLGGAGEYYWRNDFEHLAGIIKTRVLDPAGSHALGLAAQERARAKYTWEGVTDQYVRLFEILGGVVKQPRET